jgi:hypothetical protein
MSEYRTYPAVDENYNFHPLVRQAIVAAPETDENIKTKISTMADDPESELRQKLDYLYRSNVMPVNTIDGGSP